MTRDRLISEVQLSWDPGAPRSYSLEVPPGCGSSWMARQLVAEERLTRAHPAPELLRICRLDGEAVAGAWEFSRKLVREWRLDRVTDLGAWDYREIREDRDASELLGWCVRRLRESGFFPVLVVDNFHKLARGLDTVLGQMRTLEQDGSVAAVTLSPVNLNVLKQRWQDSGVFFANSDYGDNHEDRFVGPLEGDDLARLQTEIASTGPVHRLFDVVRAGLGNRPQAYVIGLSVWRQLQTAYPRDPEDVLVARFVEEVEMRAPATFQRFLKWLDHADSVLRTQALAAVHEGRDRQFHLKALRRHAWSELLLAPERDRLACSGLGEAAVERCRTGRVSLLGNEGEIAALCRNLTYLGAPVLPSHVDAWLRQFPSRFRTPLLVLLRHLRQDYYFDEGRVNRCLMRLYKRFRLRIRLKDPAMRAMKPGRFKHRLRLVSLSNESKSEGRILHSFRKVNALPAMSGPTSALDEVLKEVQERPGAHPPVVAVDDFIGSGGSALRFIGDSFIGAFGEDERVWPIRSRVHYLAITGFRDAIEAIEERFSGRVRVLVEKTLDESDRVFSNTSRILADPEIRESLRELTSEIGSEIYRPEHSLGYENGQALVVFYYDVPNNTLPILFEPGSYRGRPWLPLLARPDARR